MRKTKVEKGITLVALIITIIVLLILAVVAISAVRNDGIIDYAKNARNEYEKAQTDEQSTLDYYLSQIEENDPETIKRKEEEAAEELDLLERYILGEDKAGRTIANVVPIDSNSQATSFENVPETIANAEDKIRSLFTSVNEDMTKDLIYARYNYKVYKIVTSRETNKTEAVEMIYEPKGREGDLVRYDSDGKNGPEDWKIITDRGGKVEIVSADVMYGENNSGLVLGKNDAAINEDLDKYLDKDADGNKDDFDGNGTIGNDGDLVIASYNNLITTINNYCKSLVTAETDKNKIRSVGGINNNTKPYSSTNYNNLETKIKVDLASGDIQYEMDLAKMYYHGIANIEKNYFTSSRTAGSLYGTNGFCVRYVMANGWYGNGCFFVTDTVGQLTPLEVTNSIGKVGVRPIVINPSGI